LGAALQKVLRQYTNAAATLTTEILSFISRFALQVWAVGGGVGWGVCVWGSDGGLGWAHAWVGVLLAFCGVGDRLIKFLHKSLLNVVFLSLFLGFS
jgi:hypothetical protein